MIVADLDSIEGQMPQTPEFRKAVEFLRRKDLLDLPDGKVEIDGSRIFAILQRYRTASAAAPQFEYHRRYLDIQFVLSGEELIAVAPAVQMVPSRDFDEAQDVCFGLMQPGTWSTVRLTAGRLAVLWPEDGHAPRLASGKPCLVRKIVVKIEVE